MRKYLLSSFLLLCVALSANAQEFKTGYFLENYSYAYRINAGAPIEGKPYFFGGIGLGNVSIETHTNLSVPSFLATARDGSGSLILPLLSSDFTMEEAMAGFADSNDLCLNANVNLLTLGWQGEFNRITLEVNARTDSYLYMPYDLFTLVKNGLESIGTNDYNKKFAFFGLDIGTDAYSEIAFGYTHKIGDIVTLGGRVKGLIGLGSVGAGLDLSLEPGKEKDVAAKFGGNIHIASPVGVQIPTVQSGGKTYYDYSGFDSVGSFTSLFGSGPKAACGWGLGMDLGITVQPLDGLYLTAGVNDLGFINWKCNFYGGIGYDSDTQGELDSDDYVSALKTEVLNGGKYVSYLNYSIHAGAKYKMPFYDRLSVGLLGTFQKHYKEARLGVDVTPLDFISLAASAALTNYGGNFGAALNLKFPIVNFFIGTDAFFFNLTPQMIPLDPLNTMITAGLLIAI